MRRRGKFHVLSVLHDALPDDVLELCRDLQPGQVLVVITQGRISIREGCGDGGGVLRAILLPLPHHMTGVG